MSSKAREESWDRFADVSYEQVQETLLKWGNSLGLPGDWIPRAALRTQLEAVDAVVWAAVTKAWQLLARPKAWGISRQVAPCKRGDIQVYASWRNIMINKKFGLLMERVFWTTVVDDVRKALGEYPTGYVHRCEYHALCFHEVAASRLHMGVGLMALLGDLVGAFPKTWRELVVVLACLEAHVQGTRLVLLKDFLRHTAVKVYYNGQLVVETNSGYLRAACWDHCATLSCPDSWTSLYRQLELLLQLMSAQQRGCNFSTSMRYASHLPADSPKLMARHSNACTSYS